MTDCSCMDCGTHIRRPAFCAETGRCDSCAALAEQAEEMRVKALDAEATRIERRRAIEGNVKDELLSRAALCVNLEDSRDITSTAQIDAAQAWAVRPAGTLWLYGPTGTGKTHIARGTLRECCSKFRWVIAEVSAHKLVRLVRDWDRGEALIRRLTQAHLLMLDDIDKPRWNESEAAALWRLMDERWPKPLIVTCNQIPGVLAERWTGDDQTSETMIAAVDRMKPITGVEFTGASRRGVQGPEL